MVRPKRPYRVSIIPINKTVVGTFSTPEAAEKRAERLTEDFPAPRFAILVEDARERVEE